VENGMKAEFHPVTRDRWKDLEKLFGKSGACGGCWCMWFRSARSTWNEQKGEGNKKALRKLIAEEDLVVGMLGYVDGEPAGWISFGRREEFPVVEKSRLFQPVDPQPVWSVVCFFVARRYRRNGLTEKLLQAAILHARKRGARIVEAYPIEPKKKEMPDVFAYHGFASIFRKNGFQEVARRSETRPMMRLDFTTNSSSSHKGQRHKAAKSRKYAKTKRRSEDKRRYGRWSSSTNGRS
jgi:GNAT superfamily N-acetyltransferase